MDRFIKLDTHATVTTNANRNMLLPPERLTIKRRRDEDPVDCLCKPVSQRLPRLQFLTRRRLTPETAEI